jgi:hypothetical protein
MHKLLQPRRYKPNQQRFRFYSSIEPFAKRVQSARAKSATIECQLNGLAAIGDFARVLMENNAEKQACPQSLEPQFE